jgi:hypothetical protein
VKRKEIIGNFATVAIIVLYGTGMLLMPEDFSKIGEHLYHRDIGFAMSLMYISYGAFAFPTVLFAVLFGDDKAGKMTLAFYYSVTILFFVLSIGHLEYLASAIILLTIMIAVTVLMIPSKTENKNTNNPTL